MKHRIRAAALVVRGERLLLIKSRDRHSGEIFWIPPGGGVEGDESVFDCARRETFEEAGILVEFDRIVYLRQFIEQRFKIHHFEVFILCSSFTGELTTENNPTVSEPDAYDVLEARFLSRREMEGETVYPQVLKDEFWDDPKDGFPAIRHLGMQYS
ncbi:MAG: NUDIX hydrolase [Chloroflexota bacterium]|nr:NUDIX hydrolase [Chloroflexota bacterium]MDE2941844.1 NUDIX hydrolase [Chloroflexota bacterium]MDE3268316.1 NUDIX hydrolase [Chloroflexota bacterium]